MATRTRRPQSGTDRVLNFSLWAVQVMAFVAFAIAAWMKIMFPISRLADIWPWTGVLSPFEVRGLGVIDLLGGVGLVLPMLTRIWPRITIAAAVGCGILQLCAMIFHTLRGEVANTPVNIVLLAMVIFVAWGRRRLWRGDGST